MAEFVTVARVEEVPPGTTRAVRAGDRAVALANVGGELYAFQGECPHLKGPLGDGRLDGPVLTCPWHGWQFDVTTGRNEFDLSIEVARYPVRVEDGEIKVAV